MGWDLVIYGKGCFSFLKYGRLGSYVKKKKVNFWYNCKVLWIIVELKLDIIKKSNLEG